MYCNMNLSYKINRDNILYKKIEETHNEINEIRKKMNDKFDSLIETLKAIFLQFQMILIKKME